MEDFGRDPESKKAVFLHLDQTQLNNVAGRMGMTVLSHPFDYTRVLIQIGYEPIAPVQTTTLLGRPVLQWPSVPKYISFIYSRSGFVGLFSGLSPRLLSTVLTAVIEQPLGAKLEEVVSPVFKIENKFKGKNVEELSDDQLRQKLIDEAILQAANKVAMILITQPFHVISVRMMAQFVGGDTTYNGIVSSLVEIFKLDGVSGLWSGLMPRAVGELACIGISSALAYFIPKYLFRDRSIRRFVTYFCSIVASSLTYPFHVVCNCMVVSRSHIMAGYPPHMPLYDSWTDCWSHLSRNHALRRGNSMFFRYYKGPQVIVGNKVLAIK